jgi:hypothetical protein
MGRMLDSLRIERVRRSALLRRWVREVGAGLEATAYDFVRPKLPLRSIVTVT